MNADQPPAMHRNGESRDQSGLRAESVCLQAFAFFILCVFVPLWLASAFAQTPDELAEQRHAKAAGEAMQRNDYAAAELEYLELVRSMPDVAELRSNLGLAYYLQKKYQPAEEEFQRALKLKPSLYAPNYFLGRIRHSQKRFRDALPLLERALSLQPDNAEVLRQLAATYVALKDFRKGLASYRTCLEKNPRDIETLYDLGVIYMNLAQQAFDRLSEISESAFSSLVKADHYARAAEWNEAERTKWRKTSLEEYRRALEASPQLTEVRAQMGELELKEQNWDSAVKCFEDELKVDPSSYWARFGLSQIYIQRQDLVEATRFLNEAARIRPEFFDPLPPLTIALPKGNPILFQNQIMHSSEAESFAEAFIEVLVAGQLGDATKQSYAQRKAEQSLAAIKSQVVAAEAKILKDTEPVKQKGLRLLKEKRYEAGTDLLLPLARIPESSSQLQLAVIKALLSMKQYETAAELLEIYADRLKDDPEPHYLRGLCYQNASIEKIQRMASIDPESYRLRWLMGDIYFEQERYEAAIKEYQAALNLQPGNSYLYLNLGNVCHRQMRYAEAAKYYERSVEADPHNAQAQLMLGDSLLLERNVEQAMARLRTALALDPSLLEAHVKIGKAFAMLNRFEEAARELEQATGLDKDGSVHYQLGTYYRQLGKEEKAKAALEKSKELKRQQLKRQELRTMNIEQKTGDHIDTPP